MLWRRAPAKINLTLRVIGRRADGWHEIESLVAFGGICDWLGFEPGPELDLGVEGPTALDAGPVERNLVLLAARALAARVPDLTLGRFRLVKRLPAAAGLGGGSADAAAALRALVEANRLSFDDGRVRAAAIETGADVPVCLNPRAQMMAGIGDRLGPVVSLPRIFAVLVNPRVATSTAQVFAALGLKPGSRFEVSGSPFLPPAPDEKLVLDSVASCCNDLEQAGRELVPAIGLVLERLSRSRGAKLTRMSGSGATCFALFNDRRNAATALHAISAERPEWWTAATCLR
jgi:4-diphosphocytidyl-2-C-methyl-D-erythritol kinase